MVRTPSPLNLPEADPPSLQAGRQAWGKVLQGRQVDRRLHLGSGDSFLDKEKKNLDNQHLLFPVSQPVLNSGSALGRCTTWLPSTTLRTGQILL